MIHVAECTKRRERRTETRFGMDAGGLHAFDRDPIHNAHPRDAEE